MENQHSFKRIGWIVRHKVSTREGYEERVDSLSFSLSKQNSILAFNGRTADKEGKFKHLREHGRAECVPLFIRTEDCNLKRKRKKKDKTEDPPQTSSGADPASDSSP
jgi:hypothetical protein